MAPSSRRSPAKKQTLFTIGYEKATAPAVLGELKSAGVELLVDVRAVAASRRPGFSKRQLAAGLDETGIGYLHLQKLGTPADGRQAARAGHRDELFRIYEKHLATPLAIEQMSELDDIVRAGRKVCLLCYERDAHICHRLRVAEIICERCDVPIEHLAAKLF
ncbi:MAG TPA: DUF488 domain-containing protein [Xanthobacteraceae bacterium]|jgi:uncharacterized protein (DUF488 family)|nr:DUF488 domain-containing protein [Xanthobacteraceae bacterium]